MNQGENAPPMHPRCRCTIVASIDDGKQGRKTTDQRAAEKRTRVPADMSYSQWKARYITGLAEGENENYRHLIPEIPYKPVSEERYNQLIIPLKKMGVTIHRGGEVDRYLKMRGAEADTIGKYDVFFLEKVSISAILEETHHVRQNQRGFNDDKEFVLRSILNEIDAKKYLLRVARKYGIPREEIEATKIQLEEYEAALKEYIERSGGGNGA